MVEESTGAAGKREGAYYGTVRMWLQPCEAVCQSHIRGTWNSSIDSITPSLTRFLYYGIAGV